MDGAQSMEGPGKQTNQQAALWRSGWVRIALFNSVVLSLFCRAAAGMEDVSPSPSKPWHSSALNDYEAELARGAAAERQDAAKLGIDPKKVYGLPELIDIAERSNPQTRVAWEHARQAAESVGLSQSAYFPYLAASAGASYDHLFFAFPTLEQGPGPRQVSVVGGGSLVFEVPMASAALSLKWLLFDFGERKAGVNAAKEQLVMANVVFNATHQQIVFAVTQRFYELNTARQKVEVAQSSLEAAETISRAAQARMDQGLATKPEVLQAQEQTARAAFDLEAANSSLSDAQIALVESLGILPTTELQVADMSGKPLPASLNESLDDMMELALSQRPDLIAALANVRARRAEVAKARAAYYPKIGVGASAGWAEMGVRTPNLPYVWGNDPIYGAALTIELPLFDGFARSNQRRQAESELEAAQSELAASRDAAIREVWQAYTDLTTSLRKQDSATELLSAAGNAFEASEAAYRQGLGTYVDVANAQRSLAAARSDAVDTRAAIYTASTALALSVGDLGRGPNRFTYPHGP
jgi:outer membrane protein TolC